MMNCVHLTSCSFHCWLQLVLLAVDIGSEYHNNWAAPVLLCAGVLLACGLLVSAFVARSHPNPDITSATHIAAMEVQFGSRTK